MMGFATPDKPMADQPSAITVLTRDNDTLRAQLAAANEKLEQVEAWRQGLLGFADCLRVLGDPKLGQMVISEHVVKHAADLERVLA